MVHSICSFTFTLISFLALLSCGDGGCGNESKQLVSSQTLEKLDACQMLLFVCVCFDSHLVMRGTFLHRKNSRSQHNRDQSGESTDSAYIYCVPTRIYMKIVFVSGCSLSNIGCGWCSLWRSGSERMQTLIFITLPPH